MNNLTLLTLIQQNLLNQGIDTEVTFDSTSGELQTTLELSDLSTGTPIGIAKGNTLEEAFATILGRFAGQSRDIKTGRVEPSLTEL